MSFESKLFTFALGLFIGVSVRHIEYRVRQMFNKRKDDFRPPQQMQQPSHLPVAEVTNEDHLKVIINQNKELREVLGNLYQDFAEILQDQDRTIRELSIQLKEIKVELRHKLS